MENKQDLFKEVPYLRAFKIKYIGATNTRGSRVKIIDLHRSHEKEINKVISYNYEYNNIWEIATDYLNKLGIKVLYRGGSKNEDFLLSDNFQTDLK